MCVSACLSHCHFARIIKKIRHACSPFFPTQSPNHESPPLDRKAGIWLLFIHAVALFVRYKLTDKAAWVKIAVCSQRKMSVTVNMTDCSLFDSVIGMHRLFKKCRDQIRLCVDSNSEPYTSGDGMPADSQVLLQQGKRKPNFSGAKILIATIL